MPKKCPPGADLGDRVEAERRLVDTSIGWRTSVICWSISASRISFSNDAVRPPSSQPAPWYSRLAPPMIAPQIDISALVRRLGVDDDGAVALEAATGGRTGAPAGRVAIAAFTYSGVPNAGDPVRMSTFEVKPP